MDSEFKKDCAIWLEFLNAEETESSQTVNRLMMDFLSTSVTSEKICFYSDASGSEILGYGALLGKNWINGNWEEGFVKTAKPSIEYLELFALVAGIMTWESKLRDCRIIVFCDNQSVVHMVNGMTSSCKNCMLLIRLLILNGL